MTKSTGVGRGKGGGGAKPGAGRPRKLGAAVAKVAGPKLEPKAKAKVVAPKKEPPVPQALRAAIEAVLPSLDDETAPTLDDLEVLAKKALRQILEYGPQDGPRVSAAKLVRDWKKEDADRAAEAAGVTGKKAAAQAAAQDHAAAGGKFAPPPTSMRFQ